MSPRVLYVAGHPRSGSTIFGNLLDEVPGVFHAGELHYLWTPGLPEPRQRCGCGEAVRECPQWRRIFARAFAVEPQAGRIDAADLPTDAATAHGLPGVDAPRLHALQRQAIAEAERGRSSSALTEYREILGRLYRAIGEETGARLVVDSSKWPYDARVAADAAGVQVDLVHLVREPWGVVFSRLPRDLPGEAGSARPPSRARVVLESVRWLRSTRAAEGLVTAAGDFAPGAGRGDRPGGGRTLRYEDFVAAPEAELRRLLDDLGLEDAPLPLDGRSAALTPNHTVGGNRNRWRSGTVEIRADRKWKNGLRRSDALLVSLATWPYRRHFGYRP